MKTLRFSGVDIKAFFANTPQITFEVTEKCNLNCTYSQVSDLNMGGDENTLREKVAHHLECRVST